MKSSAMFDELEAELMNDAAEVKTDLKLEPIVKIRSQIPKEPDFQEIHTKRANGTRKINIHERYNLNSLITYQAHTKNAPPLAIELSMQLHFNIEETEDLTAREFIRAVEFIINWNGVN